MTVLSEAVRRIKVSPTMAITARAGELKRAGRDIVTLSAGEPDFPTPEHIRSAAVDAIAAGKTGYTAPDGISELKDAIRRKFSRENDLEYGPDQISVGSGGKQILFNALMATLDKGDEVIFAAPYWVSYPDMVSLLGGTPHPIETSAVDNFRITPAQLKSALTSKTKWLILNSPSNPTGSAYSEDHLRDLADVLRQAPNVLVLCDDIYEHLVYEPFAFATLATIAPDLQNRILTLNGVSKAFSMTGWRIGYAGGPAELIAAMRTIQSQSTSNPCSISQWAAVAALNGPLGPVEKMRNAFRHRRDKIVNEFRLMPGIECSSPDGAFYVFPSMNALVGGVSAGGTTLTDDAVFCETLLEEADVALVPGQAFGKPGHFRLSFASSDDQLTKALDRIRTFVVSTSR